MRTLEDIKTDFLATIKESLQKACDEAYIELVYKFEHWAESDIESNAQCHIKRDIEAMLGGEDPHWIKSMVSKYDISDYRKIREMIWKENANGLTKSLLESKDKKIEELNNRIDEIHKRMRL